MIKDEKTNSDSHDGTDNQGRQGQTVADLLQHDAGRPKGRRRDVVAAEDVDNNSDDDVDHSDERLAQDHRLCKVARLAHLGDDVEEAWRATERKHDCAEG